MPKQWCGRPFLKFLNFLTTVNTFRTFSSIYKCYRFEMSLEVFFLFRLAYGVCSLIFVLFTCVEPIPIAALVPPALSSPSLLSTTIISGEFSILEVSTLVSDGECESIYQSSSNRHGPIKDTSDICSAIKHIS